MINLSSRVRRGFSIVELLVVIGILALLFALLIPVGSRAREMARQVQCASNMKQIIQATLAYAADNNGYLPQPNDKAFTYTPGWLYTPPLTAPVNPLQLDAQAETGSLWNYLRTHSVYHCPDDIDPPYPDPQYAHYLTSYIFNDVLLGFPRDNTVHPAFAYPWRRLSPLGVLFWDGGEQLSNNPWNDATSYPDEGIGTRHAGGANIGFFSGSVEWMSAAQIQQELTKTPGRFWCNPATSSGQ